MSPRIPPIDPEQATGKTAELLTLIKTRIGFIPNLVRTLAQSPAALEAYVSIGKALATGTIPLRVREQLALTIGQANGCDYCVAAHTIGAQRSGLALADVMNARQATSAEAKVAAQLEFAAAVVVERGQVSDAALSAIRAAGCNEAEIVEIIAHVAANILTNYTNLVAQTTLDFPPAPAQRVRT